MPFDTVKMTPFIKDPGIHPDSEAIAKAIISLAHNMNLKVVAEGVETEDQWRFLKENGCDQVQGYFFCHPLPEASLVAFLREG